MLCIKSAHQHVHKVFVFVFVCRQRTKGMSSDLRAVRVTQCSMCVVLSPGWAGTKELGDPRQVDRQAILTSLSIQTMFGQSLEDRIKVAGGDYSYSSQSVLQLEICMIALNFLSHILKSKDVLVVPIIKSIQV